MPSPFPGMDPYLEAPDLWPNVHTSLIVALRDDLAPRLRPRYYVAVEERTVRLSSDDLALVTRPSLAVVQPAERRPEYLLRSPTPHAPDVMTVEVPLPDDVREVYLEIRTAATDEVITVRVCRRNRRAGSAARCQRLPREDRGAEGARGGAVGED